MRFGRASSAFMLISVCSRMCQLLRLGHDPRGGDLQGGCLASRAIDEESRRRVFWCCFAFDIFIGSGVDSLITIRGPLEVQLPCSSQLFALGVDSGTETLTNHSEPCFPSPPSPNLGVEALFIRLSYLRGCILKYANPITKHVSTDNYVQACTAIRTQCAALASRIGLS